MRQNKISMMRYKEELERGFHILTNDPISNDGNAVADEDDNRFNYNIKGEFVLPEDLDAAWKAYKENSSEGDSNGLEDDDEFKKLANLR